MIDQYFKALSNNNVDWASKNNVGVIGCKIFPCVCIFAIYVGGIITVKTNYSQKQQTRD